tara:strand:+ start:168 stop:509 length:342 start_codon:yes stop_codon:yes gene_type:complete
VSDYKKLVRDGQRPEMCKRCPFRRDIRPFLTEGRCEELADNASNPYSSFPCHKTTSSDDEGETFCTEKTLTCAGHTIMQSEVNDNPLPDGMKSDSNVFEYYEMIDAHECWDGA